jgi:hypothetical protein
MTRDIAFAFDSKDGRRVEVGLDVKGVCVGPSSPSLRRSNPMNSSRMQRIAQDQEIDPLDIVRMLLSAMEPDAQQAFKADLAEMLNGSGEDQPGGSNGELSGIMKGAGAGGLRDKYDPRTTAADAALVRRIGSFAERFPAASRVQGEASPRSRSW